MASLDGLTFSNRFTAAFEADPVTEIHPRPVREAYSRVTPTPVADPKLIAWSPEVFDLIGLDHAAAEDPRFARVFGGNELLEGMDPHAVNYAGHQFGNFAGQLGDGRAIALGEVETPAGDHYTLQLKGAGPTPYSRRADGRAVLRSSIREFLCSEAMWHLGVPTTRALSLVTTGDEVVRDMFYDGRPEAEPGAVVCRVAPSFVRFGNFELPYSRRDQDGLESLARFVLATEFPELGEPGPRTWIDLLTEIGDRTAALVAEWMRVGFVHGVMNTDNLSVSGLTIDYGPYGWVDDVDPDWTPNTTDAQMRRYAFGRQPGVAYWNLGQLANAFYPLIGEVEPVQAVIDRFPARYRAEADARMATKLGLPEAPGALDPETGEPRLFSRLWTALTATETDFTIFFRNLSEIPVSELGTGTVPDHLRAAWYRPDEVADGVAEVLDDWLASYRGELEAVGIGDDERRKRADTANPRYVLRNYLAQLAIDAAHEGDHSLIHRLQDVLRRPYERRDDAEDLYALRPDWARDRPGASALSCSS